MLPSYLQMMPGGGMTPSGWDWGSVWLGMILPSVVVAAVIIIVLVFYLRREEPYRSNVPGMYEAEKRPVEHREGTATGSVPNRPGDAVLADVIKSLAPTLLDDERRVMDELVKAGGEMLQSDMPRMTDFSKATVSKAVHGLEVRGIVVREKHKWTYWCRINPRLIQRTLQDQPGLQEKIPVSA